jgi:Golgi nucleoside diphosphatase
MASPTVSEIRAAAIAVCAEPWGNLDAVANHPDRKHKFTGPVKVPHRCFELNYIAALLSVGYGFGKDERIFHVVDEIGGEEVEWTLGAFLHGIVARDSRMTEL